MNQTIFIRSQLHKCTKVHNTDYFSFINFTCFYWFYNKTNNFHRSVDHSLIYSTDVYSSFIININLYTSFINNCIDCFTLFSNNLTDLIWIYMHLHDLWSIFSNMISWCRNHWFHNISKDMFTSFFCT